MASESPEPYLRRHDPDEPWRWVCPLCGTPAVDEAETIADFDVARYDCKQCVWYGTADRLIDQRERRVPKVGPHCELVYQIVNEWERIEPDELYEEYRESVDDPRTKRTMRNYLTELEDRGLIVAEGTSRGRTYRVPSTETVAEQYDA